MFDFITRELFVHGCAALGPEGHFSWTNTATSSSRVQVGEIEQDSHFVSPLLAYGAGAPR
ncbi:hypothetical protein BT69DRAFT_1279908 [Atractiella rhizophila]|nr:hypothetical protein BT69DRAFT_1279908 [Atractiella rhizophila]